MLEKRWIAERGVSSFARTDGLFIAVLLILVACAPLAHAQDRGPSPPPKMPGLTRMSPDCDVWVDKQNKSVVMVGRVCLREGPLELFACPERSKEHEAIVSIRTKAFVVHAALLAVGAEPGSPAEFEPVYKPATGTPIEIKLAWRDEAGKVKRALARDWIRHVKTRRPLDTPWVFCGSGFWENPETKERFYLGEQGDLICVSNFPSAVLDLPINSSQANDALLFEAFTEHIPPLDTPVTVMLVPKLEDAKAKKEVKPADAPNEAPEAAQNPA